MADVELKPCPFCGGKPKVQDFFESSDETGERYGYASVECHCLGGNGGLFFHFDTVENAISAWNTRVNATPATSDTDVEPVAWRCERATNDWVYYSQYGAAHTHELHGGVIAEPLYPATALQAKEERIRELETALHFSERFNDQHRNKLSTIEAETIERCAKVADQVHQTTNQFTHDEPDGRIFAAREIAAAIRSLQGEGE